MTRLKTALIGCGKVGHFHAQALRAIAQSEFTAVCGRTWERTTQFAAQYGVRAYTSAEEMFAAEEPDLVCICTPHPLHAAPALSAAQNGCHLLIEKPLAATVEDADLILQAAKENRVRVETIVQRRFFEPCQRVKRAIDEGKIGKPILGMVTMLGWRDSGYYKSDPWRGSWLGEGGGVLVNQAPHQLDLLLWYLGEVDTVYGFARNFNHPTIEVEDTAVATVQFKSGALASIVVSNSQNPALYGKVHIFGDNGSGVGVQTDGGSMFIAGMSAITEPPYNDIWTVSGEEETVKEWRREDESDFQRGDSTTYYHQVQIEEFIQAILENREPVITGLDGLRTVELFSAIYLSSKTGRPVRFPLDRSLLNGISDRSVKKI